jgi:hypothetical protein
MIIVRIINQSCTTTISRLIEASNDMAQIGEKSFLINIKLKK